MKTLLNRLRRGDDEGSLAISMLVMIAGVGLSAVIAASSMQVTQGARVEQTRTAALQAARAGINGALATIRAAADLTNGLGAVAKLPCASYLSGSTTQFLPQITGLLGTNTKISYSVKITYLVGNPTGQSEAWVAANGNACPAALTSLPNYAYVSSTGTDALTGTKRTLFGIYAFHTVTKATTNGGQIRNWKSTASSPDLCVDAGTNPRPGSALTLQTCATSPDGSPIAQQEFGYQPGLTVNLVSSTYAQGLCVDAGSPQKAGNPLKLQLCATTAAGVLQQKWSYNYASDFFGTTDGLVVNNYCWSITTPAAVNSTITLNDTSGTNGNSACNTNYPNTFQTFNPDTKVGPGAAGLPIPTSQLYGYQVHASQLVNREEFGRCLDVTYNDVTIQHEVVFQCKQSPTFDLTNNWNQAWATPLDGLTGPIWTYSVPKSNFYCLSMPPVTSGLMLVTVKQCVPAAPTPDELWWSRGASTTAPDQQFRIEGLGTWSGLCLASLPESPAWQQTNMAGMKTCTGDPIQKWNAVLSNPSGLSGIGER